MTDYTFRVPSYTKQHDAGREPTSDEERIRELARSVRTGWGFVPTDPTEEKP